MFDVELMVGTCCYLLGLIGALLAIGWLAGHANAAHAWSVAVHRRGRRRDALGRHA